MKNSAEIKITDSEQIKLALERLDEVATRYEKKWGVDRLINLVEQHLAERFQEQLELLNSALERHAVLDVISHADALARGWAALDAAAESQGSPQIDAAAWEVVTPAGRKIAFVSDVRAYKKLHRDGWEIWSAQEVANIIDKFHSEIDWKASEALRQTKKLFTGAEITRVRPNAPVELNDEIPF